VQKSSIDVVAPHGGPQGVGEILGTYIAEDQLFAIEGMLRCTLILGLEDLVKEFMRQVLNKFTKGWTI
jgi:hypothetical protein